MLIWAAKVLDDGREPRDSDDEVSIAGREGGGVNQAAAVIWPDFTAEDTGAAIVQVDAAVSVLDVDNTGTEAVEPTAKSKVATRKTFSQWNKIAPRINFQLQPDTLKRVKTGTLLLQEAAKHLRVSIAELLHGIDLKQLRSFFKKWGGQSRPRRPCSYATGYSLQWGQLQLRSHLPKHA